MARSSPWTTAIRCTGRTTPQSKGEAFIEPLNLLGLDAWTAEKNVEGLQFGDAVEAARKFVPQLKREGAQFLIALTHLGLGADKSLAEAVPELSVIVGGHSHRVASPDDASSKTRSLSTRTGEPGWFIRIAEFGHRAFKLGLAVGADEGAAIKHHGIGDGGEDG